MNYSALSPDDKQFLIRCLLLKRTYGDSELARALCRIVDEATTGHGLTIRDVKAKLSRVTPGSRTIAFAEYRGKAYGVRNEIENID